MPRPLTFLIFFSIVMSITGSIHYYLWARLIRDTALPFRGIATLALMVLFVSMPLAIISSRSLPRSIAQYLAWPAYVWMGLMFILFMLLLAGDLFRAISHLTWLRGVEDPERRLLFRRMLSGTLAAVASGVGAYGIIQAVRRLRVKEVTISLTRLPKSLDGLTIAQLTDIHVGSTIGRHFIEDMVTRCNALEPDLIVITGDLVDGSVEDLRDQVAPIASLKAKYGVFFVTGNHEYYSGVEQWVAHLGTMGIRVLRNERVSIGDGAESFDLAGIDDYHALGMAPGHGPDLPRALAGRDPSRELILLAHQPRAIFEAAEHGVGLQLSGHTHGGQIWPFTYLVKLQQPFVAGRARVKDTELYVSCGTGYWGPPMRIGAQPEITRVTLRAKG